MYVQIFLQCHEKFKVFMDEFNLHCDNAMQWNFWWFVLNKTLQNIMKIDIIIFCNIKLNLQVEHLFLED